VLYLLVDSLQLYYYCETRRRCLLFEDCNDCIYVHGRRCWPADQARREKKKNNSNTCAFFRIVLVADYYRYDDDDDDSLLSIENIVVVVVEERPFVRPSVSRRSNF